MEAVTCEELPSSLQLSVQDWGLVDYQEAFSRQLNTLNLVHQKLARDTVVFCTHPPVVTVGRGTRPGDVYGWSGAVIEVNRGGRATYHGPSQIVAYPIVDLNPRGRDLHRYLRNLEKAIVNTLADFGVSATGYSVQTQDGDTRAVESTGVWIGSRKIASIGIGVKRWVSFHGMALNVEHDPAAFSGMKPCGFREGTMISLEEILGAKPDREAVKVRLRTHLLTALAY